MTQLPIGATENSSGQGASALIPAELQRWNWGAFFLSWIWSIGNKTYIGLFALIPFVGIVMMFVLGAKGSEWAWQNKRWQSVEHFKSVQRSWAIGGAAAFVFLIVPLTMFFIIIVMTQADALAPFIYTLF
jgi:hypothetical protein